MINVSFISIPRHIPTWVQIKNFYLPSHCFIRNKIIILERVELVSHEELLKYYSLIRFSSKGTPLKHILATYSLKLKKALKTSLFLATNRLNRKSIISTQQRYYSILEIRLVVFMEAAILCIPVKRHLCSSLTSQGCQFIGNDKRSKRKRWTKPNKSHVIWRKEHRHQLSWQLHYNL